MRRALRAGSRVTVLTAACAVAGAGLSVTGARAAAGPGPAKVSADWPVYLRGPAHTSYSPGQTRITPGNVRRLKVLWRFTGGRNTKPGPPVHGFLASPTVAGGHIYIGSSAGWFYKLSASSGRVLAKRFIGYQRGTTCPGPLGFVSTATVQRDRRGRLMVYVGGPDGYLYALRAADLSVAWRSVIAVPSARVNNYFQWSSPTVSGGRIFIGISSNCDHPLVRAGLVSYGQATGKRLAIYRPMPRHLVGASIWSSAAVDAGGDVYVSTGNAAANQQASGRADSITKLSPGALRSLGSFKVPPADFVRNGDFGGSPTIFGPYVGACDKNGIFYALYRTTMKLAWSHRVGAVARENNPCLAAAAYDGADLYVAGPEQAINGQIYNGSVQALDPDTGTVRWQTGLPNGVIGSPTVDGAGVLAVGTYQATGTPNGIYLLDAATGAILRRLTGGTADFAQNVFAEGRLFTADGAALTAWQVGSGSSSGRGGT